MSTIEFDPVASAKAAVGSHPGEVLKQAREARAESLNEVAQALKLSLVQLSAIESGKFESLPGPTFVRGFVRNYARHLGLDVEPLLAALEAGGAIPAAVTAAVDLTPVSNAKGDMPTSDEQRQRASYVPMTLVIVSLLILIAGGLYFGWFETQPAPGSETIEQSEPEIIPDGDNVGPEVGTQTPASPAVEGTGGAQSPAGASALALPAEAAAPATGTAASVPVSAPASTASPSPANALKPVLRLDFNEEAWFEVREGKDGSGKLLVNGVGTAGSSRNVQGTPPFFVVLGNAGSVKVEFNGKPVDLAPHTKKNSVASLTLQ